MSRAFTVVDGPGAPLVATAIHAGHDLRPEVEPLVGLDPATRLREEDPFTDRFLPDVGATAVVHRSRFEVDLNRDRDHCVYLTPEDSWGLEVWNRPPERTLVEGSRSLHDQFFAAMRSRLDALAEDGPFLVLDVHSYNHLRDHRRAPEESNPEVNLGTGSLDRDRWGRVADAFIDGMRAQVAAGHHLDVRENVRFRGGHLTRWVHATYPDTGCALAVEFRKDFMDEWTGVPDDDHVEELRRALDRVTTSILALVRSGSVLSRPRPVTAR